MLVSGVLIALGSKGGAAIVVPWQLALLMFVVTLVMCVGAAMVSIHKVTRLDPAMVFKG
jgi:putative ABC transport system permease protein